MWCPFVRVEGGNRLLSSRNLGFDEEAGYQHCIGTKCMGWRPFMYSHVKGGDDAFEHHGYCGLAGRPELGD